MEIKDKIALITGGGSGLGEATARHLAGRGAKVALFDQNADRVSKVAGEIGGRAFQVDVSDESSVAGAFDEIMKHFKGPARIVVNCAGIGLAARIVNKEGQLSTDLFRKVLNVNLLGSFNVLSYAVKHLSGLTLDDGEERGVVINTASIAMEDGQIGQTAYSASKGGIAAMTLPAARELARQSIRVMAIAPGLFETSMTQGLPDSTRENIIAEIPYPKRLGIPVEYALLAEHIITNPFLNGTTIRLDGAMRLPQR